MKALISDVFAGSSSCHADTSREWFSTKTRLITPATHKEADAKARENLCEQVTIDLVLLFIGWKRGASFLTH